MNETGLQPPVPASDGAPHVRVLAHEQLLDAARQAFVAEATLDMQELARRLAVSRATLYRVASSRERLLGDVLWSLATISLHTAARETRGRLDLEGVLEIGSRFRDSALGFEPLSRFAQAEPSTVAAALFAPGTGREKLARAWEDLLRRAVKGEETALTIDAAPAAEIIVSLGATMLYTDLVTGRKSDLDLVAVVIRALFSGASVT